MNSWSCHYEYLDSVCSAAFYSRPSSGLFQLVRLDFRIIVGVIFLMLCLCTGLLQDYVYEFWVYTVLFSRSCGSWFTCAETITTGFLGCKHDFRDF